jgi:hypothetical protein
MKKGLLIVAMLLSITSFAAPWDLKSPKASIEKWVQPHKVVFEGPILTDYTVEEQVSPHRIKIFYKFNKTATYTQLMTIMVYGYWADIADYEPRTFDIYIPPGTIQNTWYHNLASGDDLVPEFYDIYYLGPDPGSE